MESKYDAATPLAQLLPFYFSSMDAVRDPKTREHYHRSVRQLATVLGREAVVGDLTQYSITRLQQQTIADGLSVPTANQRVKQLRALWGWAARLRIIEEFPPRNLSLPAPDRAPDVYSIAELAKLLAACGAATGWIGPHPASSWWLTLHWLLLEANEPMATIFGIRREWFAASMLRVPGSARKSEEPASIQLSKSTTELLAGMLSAPSPTGLLLDRDWRDDQTTYGRYRVVIRAAGLTWIPRRSGLEKVRATGVALRAQGGIPYGRLTCKPTVLVAANGRGVAG